MSEETNTTEAAEATEESKELKTLEIVNPDTGETEVYQINEDEEAFLQKDGFKFVMSEFGGKLEGFAYHFCQMDSVTAAVEKYGEEVVLNCVNNELRSGSKRRAVSSKVPKYDDENATAKAIEELKKTAPVLFSQAEADAFVPGERERTVNVIFKEIKAARSEGKMELAMKLFSEAQALLERERDKAGLGE